MKYDIYFTDENENTFKVLTFETTDDRFSDYFIDTIASNLQYDFNDLSDNLFSKKRIELVGFNILEKDEEK